ncbi:MAG: type VI secretion system lipoprotein TssJ, partial [Rhizobacter sp.]|nr:type VI secretion system lipoprotein TssJ [Rhizobacter sp.]
KKPPPPPPPPPPPKPGTLSITIAAADNINPDIHRRPSPVMIRLYELKASAPFESADFLSLFERDQATLGADLVAREEFAFRPGESKLINKPLAADTKFIGVMVAFRELERARWRGLVAVQPHKDNQISVAMNGVTVICTLTAV